jgi:gluconokinase
MGVSGSGKSTVGSLLAERLGYRFFDGDDYHPESNLSKMSGGEALTDTDRMAWLKLLNKIAVENQEKGAVIVCSALKENYRTQLQKNLENNSKFLYLQGSMKAISRRLAKRKEHFMPTALLQSQFDTLEEPKNAICISIIKTPIEIISEFIKKVTF